MSFNRVKLGEALKSVFSNLRRISAVSAISAVIFVLLVLSSFPEYSYQMLGYGLGYIPVAFEALLTNMSRTVGLSSIILTGIYSVAVAAAIVHGYLHLKFHGLELKGLASIGPGLIATGCAGCGAGILGFAGFFGALAFLPLQGDLVKLAGIGLLIFFLGSSGSPEKCGINRA